jgi:hypothetical protein
VADIAIDYELLNQLGKDLETLKYRISDARTSNHNFSTADVGGPYIPLVMEHCYQVWGGAFKHAWDLLESLSSTYTGVAQQWFEQDAGYAATANEQAAGFTHSMWEMKKSAYDNWQKLSHTYVTVHGFDDNGNPYDKQVPLADPNTPPEAPGQEPTSYTFAGPDGSQHTTTSTYDADGNLTSSDSTVTDGNGGLSYHEHTSFGDNGSYNLSVENPDGSKSTETVTGNADGTGTKVDVITGSDGKTTTTTYTGTGVNGPDPTWTQFGDTKGDDSDPHTQSGGVTGSGGGSGGEGSKGRPQDD